MRTTLVVVGVLAAVAVVGAHLVVLRGHLRAAGRWWWEHPRALAAPLARRPRWQLARRDQVLWAAVLTGLAVRLIWVTVATRAGMAGGDAAEYLRTASDLADGVLPRFNGRPSAFWAPGYPALLAPLELLSRSTGIASTLYLASLLNAIAGASTVLSTAYLASAWIGPRSRNVAAWLMALAPGQVYWTSTQHAESVHTAVLLGVFVLITWVARRWPDGRSRSRWMVFAGVLVGASVLIRTPGLVALVLALLVVRSTDGRWRPAAKAVGLVFVGSLVLLVPWTLRNGIQVGFWSPTSSNNATATCLGHHPEVGPSFDASQMTQAVAEDCYRYSPYDDPTLGFEPPFEWEYGGVDEPRWYREATRAGLGHALADPARTLRLSVEKVVIAYRDDADALPGAANFVDPAWAGSMTTPLDLVATWWVWGVLGFAATGLALSGACRRATSVWVPPILFTAALVAGTSYPHYRHPAMPFLVMLAAGGVVALADRVRDGSPAPAEVSEDPTSAGGDERSSLGSPLAR